ncbi:MAG: LysR substrate-binding domain-containing protein [Reyranella sp.]|nr:LysR substrate-binding domain-containing protein [Reyranella sp.]MDP3160451.1 LysR substrate-binding domain-containing protein [Reyranella sp.]
MLHTQIRAFDAVAREGSFSRAAEALGLTQPALTIQVKALEETYGVKLLIRHRRSVQLTEMGERLFRMSRRYASLEEQMREVLVESVELEGGRLSLTADGPHIAMGVFARFLARHPSIELSVAMGNTRFVREQLLERRTDLAILPGVERHPQIHAVPLWRHTAVLIVANDHPWAGRENVELAELDGQPMVSREEGSNTRRVAHQAMAKAGIRPRVVLELGSREAVCEAVGAGLGLGVVWQLEAEGSTRFRTLAIRGVTITSTDYIACLKSERMRRTIKAFFQVAAGLSNQRSEAQRGEARRQTS